MFGILRNNISKYIRQWERRGYKKGVPDSGDLVLESYNMIPSYRLICIAVFKNDIHLQSLGMDRPNCQLYSQLKREELILKGKIKIPIHLELFQ